MLWHISHRADPLGRRIADRHYNRQKVGAPQFVPPGRCVVLTTGDGSAIWVTSWPFPEYVKHAWPGAWVCSAFRNESRHLASKLNRQALAVTLWEFGQPPRVPSIAGPVCFVSFIDRKKVRPVMVRGEPVWGWSWYKVGWEVIGETKGGLLALGMRPENMPPAEPPLGAVGTLFAGFECRATPPARA